jgi:3-phosphoshikimate 1-carboxyvinyltransferase
MTADNSRGSILTPGFDTPALALEEYYRTFYNNSMKLPHNTIVEKASIDVPGSKSIALRALLFASLGSGKCRLTNLPVCDDVNTMIGALRALGVKIRKDTTDKSQVIVTGIVGATKDIFSDGTFINRSKKPLEIHANDSGITSRFLMAILGCCKGTYKIYCSPRLMERPHDEIIFHLKQIGATVEKHDDHFFIEGAPYKFVKPNTLDNNNMPECHIKGKDSSQTSSAFYIADQIQTRHSCPHTVFNTDNVVPSPYFELTKKIENELHPIDSVANPKTYHVEGDATHLMYFVAGAVIANKTLTINGVGDRTAQGDFGVVNAIADICDQTIFKSKTGVMVKGTGVPYTALQAFNMDIKPVPDAGMVMCILALFANKTSIITGIESWYGKECDRAEAMRVNLTALGAKVEIGQNLYYEHYIKITPPKQLKPNVHINTFNDHRIAMCFSLVCLGPKGVPVFIDNHECVSKTFEQYWDYFDHITWKFR